MKLLAWQLYNNMDVSKYSLFKEIPYILEETKLHIVR